MRSGRRNDGMTATRNAGYVEGMRRDQIVLLPDRVDDYVAAENEVRFVDAFVESLDLGKLGFTHSEPNVEGRPAYNPRDLLKLYVWGYLNQVRSSRRLERECRRNLEAIWLMKRLTPDFKTIADFRRMNVDRIRSVFKEFVCLCRSLDLFGAELIGVDGCKLRAVNGKKRNFTRERLEEALKRLEEKIQRYLAEMESNDKADVKQSGCRSVAELKEKVSRLQEKREEYREAQRLMQETGRSEVSLTDPDSRLMRNDGKLEVCYNTHTAIDAKHKLIATYKVTSIPHDRDQLSTIANAAKEDLAAEHIDAVADGGFYSAAEIKHCLETGVTPYIPEPHTMMRGLTKKAGIPTQEFTGDRFIYDNATDTYLCPAGERLTFTRWNKNMHGRTVAVYRTNACHSCPFFMTKCTRNKAGRTIWRWEHEEILEEMRMRQQSPEGRRKLLLRSELCEHPYGTIKTWFNHGLLLLKGLRKVNGEVGFMMLAYNMRRAINILGVKTLIAAIT
jgi:transposase